ncbi:dihydrolipoamide acetyltransferase family protein [Fontivita pretiosa]|uniref:dihydrolipoamide acetyltransferase family protein n=1 Tax=Fontivita pretiosa TaxID=2989684 RepID=UPI003D16DF8E
MARAGTDPNVFYLPDLGEGLSEAELVEWTVAPGQHVSEHDTIARMETDKALVEVPSPREGTIAVLHGKPGDRIKVGMPLVTYQAQDQPAAGATRIGGGESADAGTVVGTLSAVGGVGEEPGKVRAAPAVRRLARDLGVDLEQVQGTGIGGRITSRDVQAAARAAGLTPQPLFDDEPPAPPPIVEMAAHDQREPPSAQGDCMRITFRGVRRTIAEHLRYSVTHAVHYTVMDEADVSALENLRRKLMAASNEKISLLPFVASAVCRVLSGREGSQFNRLNSTVDDEKQEIVQHRRVHLGIATDTESGLMVPVIHDADKLGVLELARRIAQLAKAARDRTLPRDQLTGSTFTISNFGSYAGRFGTPIINYPEAGILAVGRAREGVVVRQGMIGVGRLLPLSLGADHRVIDGGTAATALAKIIQLLQNPDELLPTTQ